MTLQATLTSSSPDRTDYITALRDEVDIFWRQMTQLKAMSTTEVLEFLSAALARVGEIRVTVYRDESRKANAFRTRELDPFISQVDLQFKIWSRLITHRQLEWDMSRGQT
jgi:hypothetical protein